ncbi:DUF58 domain-containing protein [Methylotuvimicrobium alcaliphilum]|uniref:Uncharacterized protein n=1 Tax=Methylotuvimicrobium alcaliphilum (strain DSM 19304 / NCIMB 14124 / VKM B-2133 / 20Z) TaxID=1091494 RepID=G4SYI0_META2|nr:DUF58 domain-containing protein [Methylotuvimicrobium alcaliphilum]CCE22184.1 conserved membrane protein of unknown function [Methylotuvimicrobium alcaliphilum 20Z]
MNADLASLKQGFGFGRFFRRDESASGPLELTRRRVFILPTQRGLSLVYTIVLLLLVALIYNNNLVYGLAFFLASLFFVSILHTYRALAGLVVKTGYAAPVFAGESAGLSLTVSNPTDTRRHALSAHLENESVFDLEARQSKTLTLYMRTQQRGWHSIGAITLASHYPLGLFRAWSPLRFSDRILVYPKPARDVVPFPDASGSDAAGQSVSDRGGQDDFIGTREYQAGDLLRQIHWKAYAKGQGLLSKQYAGESVGTELWLDYGQAFGERTEDRLSRLCRWILDADTAGLRYGLRLPGCRIPPDHGASHRARCLKALALFEGERS